MSKATAPAGKHAGAHCWRSFTCPGQKGLLSHCVLRHLAIMANQQQCLAFFQRSQQSPDIHAGVVCGVVPTPLQF